MDYRKQVLCLDMFGEVSIRIYFIWIVQNNNNNNNNNNNFFL